VSKGDHRLIFYIRTYLPNKTHSKAVIVKSYITWILELKHLKQNYRFHCSNIRNVVNKMNVNEVKNSATNIDRHLLR